MAGQMHRSEHQRPCVAGAAAATNVLAAAGAGGAADAAGMAGTAGLAADPPQGSGEKPAAYAALARRSCRSSTAHATAASDSALAQSLSSPQARAARCGAPGSVAELFGAPSASGAPDLVREEQLAKSYGLIICGYGGIRTRLRKRKCFARGPRPRTSRWLGYNSQALMQGGARWWSCKVVRGGGQSLSWHPTTHTSAT